MWLEKFFVYAACVLCAGLVCGQDVAIKVDLCDKDALYACRCDDEAKLGTDSFVVDVECSFRNLTELTDDMLLPQFTDSLDLSMNQLAEITHKDILISSTMTVLLLGRNKIRKIAPESFVDLPNLLELDLSENEITTIEAKVFHGIYKLRYLHMSTNKLQTLAEHAFQNLPKLYMLGLDHNNLGEFFEKQDDMFSTGGLAINPSLAHLHLGYTNLSNIPFKHLRSAYNLRMLSLAGNRITVLPQFPFTLEALDISDTYISSLSPKDFTDLPALKELFLNDLPNLTEIANHTFHPLKSLIKIELQNCKNLRHFSPFAFGVNAADLDNEEYEFPVLDINLMGSGLRTLDERLFPLFSRLTSLDIRSNPWNCDCKLKWLLQLQLKESDKEYIRLMKFIIFIIMGFSET